MAESDELARRLKKIFDDAERAAKKMADFAEGLDTKTLEKFTESAKKALNATNDLGKEIAAGAKDFRQLTKAIDELEKEYRELEDAEEAHQKQLEKLTKKYADDIVMLEKHKREADELLAAKRKERAAVREVLDGMKDFTKDLNNANAGLLKFKSIIGKTGEEVKKNLSFGNLSKELSTRFGSAAQKTLTWSSAIDAGIEAIKLAYKDVISITHLGLGSVFAKVRMQATLFGMSLEEYTDVIQKNRSTIMQLGGGEAGLDRFNQMLNQGLQSNQGLVNRLGRRGATQALSEFTLALQDVGVTMADKGAFNAALKDTSDMFLRMNALYGTQSKELQDYLKSIAETEQVQRRLNTLSKEGIERERLRLQQMTEEYKARGLSLQQIANFNTRLENLYDPTKSQFAQRFEQGINKLMYAQTLRTMGAEVDVGAVQQEFRALASGRFREARQLAEANAPMLAGAAGKVQAGAEEGRFGAFGMDFVNMFAQDAGDMVTASRDLGDALNSAARQGKNLGGVHGDLYQSSLATSQAMATVPEALAKTRETLEQASKFLESWMGKAAQSLAILAAAALSAAGGLGFPGTGGGRPPIPKPGAPPVPPTPGAPPGAPPGGPAGPKGPGLASRSWKFAKRWGGRIGGFIAGMAYTEDQDVAYWTKYNEMASSIGAKQLDYDEWISQGKPEIPRIPKSPAAPATSTTAAPARAPTPKAGKPGMKASAVEAMNDPEFMAGISALSKKYNMKPEDLLAVMLTESAGTLSPSVRNPAGGATGLIQFMPKTAQGLGTSTSELAGMSRTQQLGWVDKYFQSVGLDKIAAQRSAAGGMTTRGDIYGQVYLPGIAKGKGENETLAVRGHPFYDQNAGLDVDRDGRITKADLAASSGKRLEQAQYIAGGMPSLPTPPMATAPTATVPTAAAASPELEELKKQTAALEEIRRKAGQVPPAYQASRRVAGERAPT